MNSIGNRIRIAREQKALSQEQLGKFCNTTKQTIFKYESGIVTNIPMDRLQEIARVLSVSPAYLMGWEESPTPIAPAFQLSNEEKQLIQKFRRLDQRGKSAVVNTLEHEYAALPGEKARTAPKEA